MQWKDVSSYSRNDKECKPRSVQANFSGLTLTVTRSIYADPEDWIVRCDPLVREQKIGNGSLDDAKDAAISLLRSRVAAVMGALQQPDT